MSERKASMGDKIYRGDVVKFIRNNISLGTFMKRTVKTADEACWDLCDKLNYVPAIEENSEPHWIPCSERLPKEGEEVFVYLFKRQVPYIAWVEANRWYTEDFEVERENEPVAWMPLPEPYKGGDNETCGR